MDEANLGIGAKMKNLRMSSIDPNRCYEMNRRKMGHAVIINNVASEFPGTKVDVEELETTYRTMGFQVHIHNDCDNEKMRQVKRWLLDEATHKDSNCVAITLICHGNEQGWLLDKDRRRAWILEDFVADMGLVENLMGRPKLMVVQACRGSTSTEGRIAPSGVLAAREVVRDQIILPDKADVFIAFATVPGYVARAGDEEGSHYLQAFATFLREQYMNIPLDRIYLMVKQYMTHMAKGQQCSEERNSLRYLLNFSEYHEKTQTAPTSVPTFKKAPEKKIQERKEVPQQVQRPSSTQRSSKAPGDLELTLVVNKDPGLIFWGYNCSTVMPSSGDVVIWGKTSNSAAPHFHIYRSTGTGLTKRWSLQEFCEHHEAISLLPVKYKHQEYLAVSCIFCNKIKLLCDSTLNIITVFNDKDYFPTNMCRGGSGNIYVVHNKKDLKPVIELICSEPTFTLDSVTKTGLDSITAIAYIPRKKYIITVNKETRGVRAISKQTEEHVWAKTFTWNQIQCVPSDVLYVEERDLLFVADGPNKRILLIDYENNGAFLKVFDLDGSVIGWVAALHWYNGQLIVNHNVTSKTEVAYYSVD